METIIVDSHNEVLAHWVRECLRSRLPLVVVRIDRHHDMNHESPVLPAREGRQFLEYLDEIMTYVFEYARRELNEGNFTCPAFHYGIIGALYHFNPAKRRIDAYGRVSRERFLDVPRTRIEHALVGGKRRSLVVWDRNLTRLKIQSGRLIPVPSSITLEDLGKDLSEGCFPVVIGFDLDSLYAVGENGPIEEVVAIRLEKARGVLEQVSSPEFLCIARSQTPRAYVPAELVDWLQEEVLDLIKATYQKN